MTDRTLARTELHTLIGTTVSWSDDLWAAAVMFLRQSLNASDIEEMAAYLGWQRAEYEIEQSDPIEDFSFLPPTTMLGIYDMWRHYADVLREADITVESRDLKLYSIDVR